MAGWHLITFSQETFPKLFTLLSTNWCNEGQYQIYCRKKNAVMAGIYLIRLFILNRIKDYMVPPWKTFCMLIIDKLSLELGDWEEGPRAFACADYICVNERKLASALLSLNKTMCSNHIFSLTHDTRRPLSPGRETSWCVCRRERLKEEAGPTGWTEMSCIWWENISFHHEY